MDDASSEIYSAFFVEQEGTWSSFQGVKEVIDKHGLFCSFYSDRGSHYWTTDSAGGKVNKQSLTQFGRALQQLGIEMIAAYSPEARGRSERMFRTLQGRLPLELKSAGIRTLEDANRFLKHRFLPEFNQRFQVAPSLTDSAFVPWQPGGPLKLEDILCLQSQRTVNNDNTVSYRGQVWQIPGDRERCSYRKAKVRVNEYLDGGVAIFHGPRKLVEFGGEQAGAASERGLEGLVDESYGPDSARRVVWKRRWTTRCVAHRFTTLAVLSPTGPTSLITRFLKDVNRIRTTGMLQKPDKFACY